MNFPFDPKPRKESPLPSYPPSPRMETVNSYHIPYLICVLDYQLKYNFWLVSCYKEVEYVQLSTSMWQTPIYFITPHQHWLVIANPLSLSRCIKASSVIQIWMNYQLGQIPDGIDSLC